MSSDIDWPFSRGWASEPNGYRPADLTRRLETPAGVQVIRIGTTGPDKFVGAAEIRRSDFRYFTAWLRYTLKNGTLWFNAEIDAAGIWEQREIRFVADTLSYERIGTTHMRINAQFDSRAGTEMTLADYTYWQSQIALYGSYAAWIAALRAAEQLVNGDLAT